jgi:SAM-dependent methyltransferase
MAHHLRKQHCNNEQTTETMVDFVVTNLNRPAEWVKAVRLKLFALAYKLMGTRRQVKKARSHRAALRFGEAEAVLARLFASGCEDVTVLSEAAELATARERWDEAVVHLEKILATDPEDADRYRVKLAKARSCSGDFSGAIEVLKQVLAADPYSERDIAELCRITRETKDFSAVVAHLRSLAPHQLAGAPDDLIARTVDFGYVMWPFTIRELIADKDVLDVGCGSGVHGLSFIMAGVRSYTGLDPLIDFTNSKVKHKSLRYWTDFGYTAGQIADLVLGVELIRGVFENVAPDRMFDIAAMHNATEHFHNLEQIFAGVAARLRPGGKIVFQHHNYFAWNGHHMQPKLVSNIKPGNPKHERYMDWAHLRFADEPDPDTDQKVNKVRIGELRAITERYFEIGEWRLLQSKASEGAGRLTDEIAGRWPAYSREELTTQAVFCVAETR